MPYYAAGAERPIQRWCQTDSALVAQLERSALCTIPDAGHSITMCASLSQYIISSMIGELTRMLRAGWQVLSTLLKQEKQSSSGATEGAHICSVWFGLTFVILRIQLTVAGEHPAGAQVTDPDEIWQLAYRRAATTH